MDELGMCLEIAYSLEERLLPREVREEAEDTPREPIRVPRIAK